MDRQDSEDASRSVDRTAPQTRRQEAETLTYAQKMATAFPLAADLKASGKFDAVQGLAKAPGKGHKYRYRIDVEQGLGLDSGLFAEAVQKTLNDDRSWAHNGAMTFERISSGEPDFVITLASPGTTADWCEKSGLDTTEDNVSCDSAATDRVMINAYRWAQGASTFGPDKLLAYRQMLINHEVGHRLGHNHVKLPHARRPGARDAAADQDPGPGRRQVPPQPLGPPGSLRGPHPRDVRIVGRVSHHALTSGEGVVHISPHVTQPRILRARRP